MLHTMITKEQWTFVSFFHVFKTQKQQEKNQLPKNWTNNNKI